MIGSVAFGPVARHGGMVRIHGGVKPLISPPCNKRGTGRDQRSTISFEGMAQKT
jgi:hypothetical protein